MPLLEIPVPNLLGGTSQQPAANRQPGQAESCDNALLHVVNGWARRKGSRHLARLFAGLESVIGTHFINRDPTERYVALLGERRVRIFSARDGTEYPVKVNGTATNAGRGAASSGTPINYLDPRTSGGVVDQDEDFVIGAGDWLTVAGNSVTSYISGRGPFNFGRRQSLTAVTADTVAEVGNDAAATVSDIYQDFGLFPHLTAFSVFAKKSSSAINDFELAFIRTAGPDVYAARFDISVAGVITVGQILSGNIYGATAEDYGHGWYRCTIYFSDRFEDTVEATIGTTRRIRIRFHTNAATPANKRLLLFGARCHDISDALISPGLFAGVDFPSQITETVPPYVHTRSDLFRALTIADTTLLLNTEVVPVMDTVEGPNIATIAGYIFVRIGGLPDVNYTTEITYTTAGVPTTTPFTFTTGAGPGGLQTDDDVAEGLRAAIDADANLIATRNGNVIKIVRAASDALNNIRKVKVRDSRGDTTMVAISLGLTGTGFGAYVITHFTDLPLIMDPDTVVAVVGNPEREADDYYVQFESEVTGSLVAGHWEESLRASFGLDDGILTTLKAATMPQQLTRRQDNAAGAITGVPNAIYFDVSPVDWDERLVGDEISAPEPSFIGHAIQDLFLYRGRLGFLADENVILSEAGEVFNFWRTTVLDLPDTDPIDINAGARDTVIFRNGVPTADTLLLFSDRHQFQLLGDPVLTPSTAQLVPIRSFENLPQVRPVDSGRGVVFARSDQTFSGLMEALLLRDDVSFLFDDLTVQAPRYIEGLGLQLAHSSLLGLTAARAGDPTILYLHQSFRDDQENRLQSAPHRWTFAADTLIRGIGFLDAELRLVVERGEGWFLETVLADSEITESGRPITHLDRRVTEAQVTMTYDGPNNRTEIELPYDIDPEATLRVVDAVSGLIVPVLSQTDDTVLVSGDVTDDALYVGETFRSAIGLSEPVIQDQSPRGSLIPRMGRPLDVHRLYVYLANTAYLECAVAPDLRTESVEEFSAAGLGTGLLLEGALNLYTGDTDFAIIGQSTELAVTLQTDTPFPAFVQSARWEVLHRARAAFG